MDESFSYYQSALRADCFILVQGQFDFRDSHRISVYLDINHLDWKL